jgi:hypothetical protein
LRLVASGAVVIDGGVCRIAATAVRDDRLISPAPG